MKLNKLKIKIKLFDLVRDMGVAHKFRLLFALATRSPIIRHRAHHQEFFARETAQQRRLDGLHRAIRVGRGDGLYAENFTFNFFFVLIFFI